MFWNLSRYVISHALKKGFSIFLLAAFLLNATGNLWIMASFYAQQDLIAKTLCEKRFEKKSTCNGSCQLSKRLKENEEKEQHVPELKTQDILLFVQQEISIPSFNYCAISKEEPIIPQRSDIASGHAFAIFQPPQSV